MFQKHDISRDAFMLKGRLARRGYDWWWHSFTGTHAVTGERKAFFIEFFAVNPALGGPEPVLGQDPANRKAGRRPSYLMVKCGAWGKDARQLHRFFGWDSVDMGRGVPFTVRAGDCFLTETETRGSVTVTPEEAADPARMCSDGSMSWALSIRKETAFNVGWGASKPLRSLGAFEMFWHAEGMRTAFSGEVVWQGERYLVRPEDCFGYADKNWGRDFTSPWVWLSSSNLTSLKTGKRLTNSVFDIGGGRPKIGPLALKRKLLSSFRYEGEPYEFNFSKFWTFTRTRFDCREEEDRIVWHVEQRTWLNRMVTDIECDKADMLLIRYESPDGEMRHNRLFNGGNGRGTVKLWSRGRLVDEIRCENAGCEYGEYGPPSP